MTSMSQYWVMHDNSIAWQYSHSSMTTAAGVTAVMLSRNIWAVCSVGPCLHAPAGRCAFKSLHHSSVELQTIIRWCFHNHDHRESPYSAFTFKTRCSTGVNSQYVDMNLGRQRNYEKGQAALRIYANQPAFPLWPLRRGWTQFHIYLLTVG